MDNPFSGFNSLRDNPISNALLGAPPKTQPGVGGPTTDNRKLVLDPTTGMFFDPTTGTTYTDANGDHPVTDPNVAQQVAQNYSRSTAFLNQLRQTQGLEGKQVSHLNDVIAGRAPSVADLQTRSNLQQIDAAGRSQAAGVSGPAGPLAQLLALRSSGTAGTGAMNAGAMERAKETSDANGQLSQLLQSMAGTNAGLGASFAGLAQSGQAGQQGLDAQTAKDNQDFALKLLQGVTGAGGGAGGAAGTTSPGAAAALA